MSERWQYRALVLLAFVMAVMQSILATRQCLWTDEVFSLAMATGHSLEHSAPSAQAELGDFIEQAGPLKASEWQLYLRHAPSLPSTSRVVRAVLHSDTSPPLYYLLLCFWTMLFGTSDFAVRLFSVCCYLLSLPLLGGMARQAIGSCAVVPACILFSFSPLGNYYATEVRMYSLLVLCVLAFAYTSLILRERGGSILLYSAWVITSAAGFLTHYFFLFPWLAIAAFVFIRPGKCDRLHLAVCVVLTAALSLPWYLVTAKWWNAWRITAGWLHVEPRGFGRIRALRNQFLQFFSPRGAGLWPYHALPSLASTCVFVAVIAFSVLRLGTKTFAKERMVVWLWFVAACVGPTFIDLLQKTYAADNPRYALAALPAAYLIAALALTALVPWQRWIGLVLMLFLWTPALISIYRLQARVDEPFKLLASLVEREATPCDLILVHSIPSGVLGISRYMIGDVDIAAWVGQLRQRKVPQSIKSLLAGHKRVFLVIVHSVGEPAPEEDWLRKNARLVSETKRKASRIAIFAPKEGNTF